MKKLNLLTLIAFGSLILIACGGEKKDQTMNENSNSEEAKEEMAHSMALNLEESNVMWKGSVLGMHSHHGNINFTEGEIEMKGNEITGGHFTIDMTSITPTDSGYTEEKTPEMLVGHLSSGDFFLVDSFPTASFVIKTYDAASNSIVGDLTVRGITNEETVENVMLDHNSGTASGELTFDRQEYDVAFTHPMKDVVLSDDIELKISLKM